MGGLFGKAELQAMKVFKTKGITLEEIEEMLGEAEGEKLSDTYTVERFLGEGAFAEVYRVQHNTSIVPGSILALM